MTYKEIQDRVMSRLNLQSTEARNRIKIEINDRYRELCTSCNLARTRRTNTSFATVQGTATYVVPACTKIENLYNRSNMQAPLSEVSVKEIRNLDPSEVLQGTPDRYAIYSQSATSVTILMYPVPDAAAQMYADVISTGTDLSLDADTPTFPVDFHDILVRGVMADELGKMEKMGPLATVQEKKFEERSGDLRYFLMKGGTKKMQQGSGGSTGAGGGSGSGGGSVPDGSVSYTQSGLITFDRDPLAPFAVASGSAVVPNLDADKLDGQHGSYYQDAGNLNAGTILLARISGLLDAQISAVAAIAWTKISKVGSSLADLVTRSAGDLSSGTLLDARLSANVPLINAANVFTAAQRFVSGLVGAVGVAVGSATVGLWSSAANFLSFSTNGVKAMEIDSTQFIDSPTQPRCRTYYNSTQSINDSTLTVPAFNAETYDVGSLHDNVTNNGRLTIPTGGDGLYLITLNLTFAANATGYRFAYIRKNGTTVLSQNGSPAVNGSNTILQTTCIVNLVATDYVEGLAYQTSGGALNMGTNGDDGHTFSIVKLW
jgi:hypothetical protein